VDNNKNTPRLSHTTNLSIGGSVYKNADMSRLKPQTKEVNTATGMENAPRDVSKALKNETGTIKTGDLDNRQPTTSANNSSFTVQPTPRTANAQTETTKTQQTVPLSSTSSTGSYKNADMSRLKPQTKEVNTATGMENAPRDVSKALKNETGTIKTGDLDNRQPTTSATKTQQTTPLSNTSGTGSEERTESVSRPSVVQSIAPTKGTTLGAAYFTTLAAGRHNSMKSNIDTSNIKTNSMIDKAAEARAIQGMLSESYAPSHIIRNTGLEVKASFYEAMGRYSGGGISLSQNAKNALSISGNLIIGKAQSAFASSDDMGNQVAGGAVSTGVAAYTGFKLAQTASPMVINAVKGLPTQVGKFANGVTSVGKGVWDVTTTAGRATVTLARTAGIMSSGFIPFNAQFTKKVLLHQVKATGLLHTATSQNIISGVRQIQTSISNVKNTVVSTAKGIQTGFVSATNAVKRSYNLVRGMVNGTVMSSVVAHQALQKVGSFAITTGLKGLKIAGKGVARGVVKGGIWTLKRGLPNAAKGVGGLSMGVAGVLTSSNDMMLQGVGGSIMLANYGIRTGVVATKVTGRVIKTSVKGGIGVAKGTYKAIKFIKHKGLRAAWERARNKAATALVNAGKSVISAIVNLIKAAGQKVILPILLIAVIASVIMSVFAAPTVAVGGIFSGLFDTDNGDGTYTSTDIREFILDPTDGIPPKRTAYINDLYDYIQGQLEANAGLYDYVRFKTNTQDNIIEPTIAGINGAFYTLDDLTNIIQPIFNAVILKDYELAPTKAEARQVLTEIFDKLFRIGEVPTVEWCGQSAIDGSGTPVTHSCGSIHELVDCPNPQSGTHGSYTCTSCCYYYCNGHTSYCDEYCLGHTSYCSPGCSHACNGYNYCGSHDVLTITLNMDGLYQLLFEYFEEPIDVLANNTSRTPDQDRELSNLKDSYEICLEYIGQVAELYGGGLTMQDLSGVTWVDGSRVGNQVIIDTALTQVGQVGGQPYWSWYGFSSRVEWCACFVSWCMNQVGHSEVRYASCHWGGIPYFESVGRYASGGYTDLVAGDVIFFDWEGDGLANHTGLVIGRDDQYVYTVEGNSGDTCRTKKYALNSSVIMGYGLMNW